MPNMHPLRAELHQEVHARPPEALAAPLAVSHHVMWADADARAQSRTHLAELLAGAGLDAPPAGANFFRAELQSFGLRWEQHTEFVSWTFLHPMQPDEVFALQCGEPPPAAALQVPAAWRQALPGECLTLLHLWAVPRQALDGAATVRVLFDPDSVTGSTVISGSSDLHTDMHLHADGSIRMLVLVGESAPGKVSPRRLGRLVQRLLDIETYRMAALMGLPAARESLAWLAQGESELARLAQAVRQAMPQDEPALLDRLTRLAAELEGRYAATHTRFSASAAYFSMVEQRLADIAETRIAGMQSLHDFMQRRLTPAMLTCRSAERRQAALSQRIERVSGLLRTRVEVEQQQSSRELLAGMNRRQDLQLKLQSTVEGLSVAAISYYVLGLLAYVLKGAQKLGWPFSVEASIAVAVPLVIATVWWSMRQLHRRIVGH
ncbi:DUF3422 family protein [Ottowia testudinis]|uniref:DUF3422 domain-containing protein n=1 Tax=Ottowia testudinis TaxID=2816950 RepID=A0A975CII6_9BURK|nr:DUF3422 domain-containing protein [Ottowia testudinis]QTD46446.1 DUF3422 domain-containing protein [Ottowia testudinis]